MNGGCRLIRSLSSVFSRLTARRLGRGRSNTFVQLPGHRLGRLTVRRLGRCRSNTLSQLPGHRLSRLTVRRIGRCHNNTQALSQPPDHEMGKGPIYAPMFGPPCGPWLPHHMSYPPLPPGRSTDPRFALSNCYGLQPPPGWLQAQLYYLEMTNRYIAASLDNLRSHMSGGSWWFPTHMHNAHC